MLTNHDKAIEKHGTEQTCLHDAKEQLASAPSGFDAWLQSYRQRLEELCHSTPKAKAASSHR